MGDSFIITTMASRTSGLCIKLGRCCRGLCWESVVVLLTLLSCLSVCAEMLVDFGILTVPGSQAQSSSSSPESSSSSSSSSSSPGSDNDTHANVSGSVGDSVSVSGDVEVMRKVFHYTSLSIATLFFCEIVIKLIVFRKKFVGKIWQVVDMAVVVAAVTSEVVFEVRGRAPELEACTLVVILRLWRLPHVCNIKAQALRRDLEQELQVWKASKRTMEERWRHLQATCETQKEKIQQLQQEARELRKQQHSEKAALQSPCITTVLSNYVPNHTATITTTEADERLIINHHTQNHNQHSTSHRVSPSPQTTATDFDHEDTESCDRSEHSSDKEDTAAEGTQVSVQADKDTEEEQHQTQNTGDNSWGSASESSLSRQDRGQHQQHQMHVQIEGEDDVVKVKVAVGENGDLQSRPEEGLQEKESAVCYQNGGFSADEDSTREEGDQDSLRTYTTADGIPMTDL